MKILLALFSFFAFSTTLFADTTSLPKVILLGDSIRGNYQSSVTKALKGKVVVSAPKDNCSHTAFTLENLDCWLSDLGEADVIHINAGLHDMYILENTGKTRHTIETYQKNLRAIFKKLEVLSDAKIIFALTTAVNEKQQAESKGYARIVRRNEDVDAFNAKAKAIAEEMGIEVNDLNSFMKKEGPDKILKSSDGIHLSPEGSKLMGDEVARVILENLEKQS